MDKSAIVGIAWEWEVCRRWRASVIHRVRGMPLSIVVRGVG